MALGWRIGYGEKSRQKNPEQVNTVSVLAPRPTARSCLFKLACMRGRMLRYDEENKAYCRSSESANQNSNAAQPNAERQREAQSITRARQRRCSRRHRLDTGTRHWPVSNPGSSWFVRAGQRSRSSGMWKATSKLNRPLLLAP